MIGVAHQCLITCMAVAILLTHNIRQVRTCIVYSHVRVDSEGSQTSVLKIHSWLAFIRCLQKFSSEHSVTQPCGSYV